MCSSSVKNSGPRTVSLAKDAPRMLYPPTAGEFLSSAPRWISRAAGCSTLVGTPLNLANNARFERVFLRYDRCLIPFSYR
jgi:hypothetical protein